MARVLSVLELPALLAMPVVMVVTAVLAATAAAGRVLFALIPEVR
jgi:hypothetical protein